jgi:uncharacterized membrane-anchored protein YitT (DUF2179 family)
MPHFAERIEAIGFAICHSLMKIVLEHTTSLIREAIEGTSQFLAIVEQTFAHFTIYLFILRKGKS